MPVVTRREGIHKGKPLLEAASGLARGRDGHPAGDPAPGDDVTSAGRRPPADPAPRAAGAAHRRGPSPRVAVIGAGAFGGWTALHLLRLGASVILVDAWGAGNSRASSGGETRVIRAIYGGSRRHIEWAARSLRLWRESEAAWRQRLYHRTGALWMFRGPDDYARSSLGALEAARLKVIEIDLREAARRYPQVSFEGIRSVFLEEEAGYLAARQACEAVREAFVAEGGEYRLSTLLPFPAEPGSAPALSDGQMLRADRYVLACGPWLSRILPDLLSAVIRPTRQEVFYFGTPAGDPRFDEGVLPAWVEMGHSTWYGIPGNQRRGLKIADDTHGDPFDPTDGERVPSADGIRKARAALAARFPALSDAPLLEARVCQYENTPDGDYLIDRHPRRDDTWIVGGGSGHGFKMGPAVGEHVAEAVLGRGGLDPAFGLSRFR